MGTARDKQAFPLGDALATLLIVGVGFTALVYLIVPAALPSGLALKPGELAFALGYLVVVALLLIRRVPPGLPAAWQSQFLKRRAYVLVYKLVVFVAVPLAAMRLLWGADWPALGFAWGDVGGQLRSAGVLIVLLGGFNLLVGSAARPIRSGEFSLRQIAPGFALALLWDLVEAGLVEEFFFRAFLQARLIAGLGSPAAGIAATSLLFGLMHAPGIYLRGGDRTGPLGERPTLGNTVLYTVLALAPTGWFTGLLYWRTQSLLAPVLVHGAIDAVASTVEVIRGLGLARRQGSP